MSYRAGGTNKPGDDGYLVAKLGVVSGSPSDFSVVYDAKSTDSTTVDADKCDFGSLEDFRVKMGADYAFFVGKAFAGQASADSKINSKLSQHPKPATLLTLDSLERLVRLHWKYGVTLTELRGLFAARTTGEVASWLDDLDIRLSAQVVPLRTLLDELEKLKADKLDSPSIKAVRQSNATLYSFSPERLTSAISAVAGVVGNRWIEIDSLGNVVLHHRPDEILNQFDRQLKQEAGE
jgi:hypothetical protein